MRKFKNLLFVLMIVPISQVSLAQTKIIIHENTTQHDNNSKSKSKQNKFYSSEDESAIKFNLTSIFRGDYSISYERKLNKDFSAECGLGFAYYDALFDEGGFFNYKPDDMVSTRREYNGGPSIRVGTRWYPNSQSEGITGGYLGAEVLFRKYNALVFNDYVSEKVKETNVHKDIRAVFGWQDMGWNENLFWDFSVGLGYRMHDRQYLAYLDPQNGYSSKKGLKNGNKNYPFFCIGIKVGMSIGG